MHPWWSCTARVRCFFNTLFSKSTAVLGGIVIRSVSGDNYSLSQDTWFSGETSKWENAVFPSFFRENSIFPFAARHRVGIGRNYVETYMQPSPVSRLVTLLEPSLPKPPGMRRHPHVPFPKHIVLFFGSSTSSGKQDRVRKSTLSFHGVDVDTRL